MILWLRSEIAHLERDMLKLADMEIIMPGTGFKPIHWKEGGEEGECREAGGAETGVGGSRRQVTSQFCPLSSLVLQTHRLQELAQIFGSGPLQFPEN